MVRRSITGEVVIPNVRAILEAVGGIGDVVEDAVATLVGVVGDGDTVDTIAVKNAGFVLADGVATFVKGRGAKAHTALIHLGIVSVADAKRVLMGCGIAAVWNAVTAVVGEVNAGADVLPGPGAVLDAEGRIVNVDDALATGVVVGRREAERRTSQALRGFRAGAEEGGKPGSLAVCLGKAGVVLGVVVTDVKGAGGPRLEYPGAKELLGDVGDVLPSAGVGCFHVTVLEWE